MASFHLQIMLVRNFLICCIRMDDHHLTLITDHVIFKSHMRTDSFSDDQSNVREHNSIGRNTTPIADTNLRLFSPAERVNRHRRRIQRPARYIDTLNVDRQTKRTLKEVKAVQPSIKGKNTCAFRHCSHQSLSDRLFVIVYKSYCTFSIMSSRCIFFMCLLIHEFNYSITFLFLYICLFPIPRELGFQSRVIKILFFIFEYFYN